MRSLNQLKKNNNNNNNIFMNKSVDCRIVLFVHLKKHNASCIDKKNKIE